ncbi:DUF3830 family protein [Ancylobacter sp. 6x-1]|uniref:DUF3830 family protein n=1 Tax=Ancylobacter crimeensis TaxID=2579147 RepID=A0ABT0D5Z4_9HYPH|nr:DUF3830 family protein [Ancylobacter crimeensis]MCK0195368.1 DUF3830 family protein [Ancylobacter crimeensis]
MTRVKVTAGPYTFFGHFEEKAAPKTVAAFRARMPFVSKIIHVRWSGEGVWVPLGDLDFGVSFENNTCYPSPGQVVLYPGGVSETELLLAYGNVAFASKAGALSGNHFLTLTEGLENIYALGRKTLLEGQQDITFELA